MCICILFVIEEESQLVFAFLKFPAISFCSSGVVCSACLLGVNGEAVTHDISKRKCLAGHRCVERTRLASSRE